VTENYQEYLTQILAPYITRPTVPIPHKRKFELVVGDASETVPRYLKDHLETTPSLSRLL
jgi:hypothetical protein